MQTAIRILLSALLGAGCGWGALCWAHNLLQSRNREDRVSRRVLPLLVTAAAICGGGMGYCIREWLPLAAALAILAVGITVAICDLLCRIIPNPTVLAIFVVKLLLITMALLKVPGAPAFGILSSLGGMVCCFLVFSAPGLLGKQVGAGDIKLAAAMGFLLGFGNALLAIALMGVLILGYCMVQRRMPLLTFLKTNIPMGPFIAAGMMLVCVLPYIPS